jgi:hypothetical protein
MRLVVLVLGSLLCSCLGLLGGSSAASYERATACGDPIKPDNHEFVACMWVPHTDVRCCGYRTIDPQRMLMCATTLCQRTCNGAWQKEEIKCVVLQGTKI